MKKLYFLMLLLCSLTAVNAQIIDIPDANFKARLLAASTTSSIALDASGAYVKIDTNNDGQIQVSEALVIHHLRVESAGITDMTGLENFVNLEELQCRNNLLSSLDVSTLINLSLFRCNGNQLIALDVSNCVNLTELVCSNNRLSTLDVSNLSNLIRLECGWNQLVSIDFNGNTDLSELRCNWNNLTTLNFSQIPGLTFLNCDSNQFSILDVSSLTSLEVLSCNDNLFQSLDLSACLSLVRLVASYNANLEILNLKNGRFPFWEPGEGDPPATNIMFSDCPNIRYVCVDEEGVADLSNRIYVQYGYTDCNLNSYCSFAPGGESFVVQGAVRYDENANGCDASDSVYKNMRFSTFNGTDMLSTIADDSGNYSIPLRSGSYTLTPVMQNSTYFTVSPSQVVIDFPAQASPLLQNFCVAANGVHPDLEVVLLPLSVARPGFDANYKMVFKNKGTNTQSGSVNLAFNDAVLDFVSANPVLSSQTVNNLTWNFTNLKPFEAREIAIVLNVNSSAETPAVNMGDVLNYTVAINSAATDETPNDNSFTLNQTVVNSYDPNDKTCLEGTTITPSEVGKYVHYVIRFENTGSANAQNIVVKDVIDATKFDINSLVPINGSHNYYTKIAGDKVEFIFENINLPFDDANNDGYVAFKIKTKPSLVLGDTFSNTANIYFDYNFPIVTNTATTTIQVLSAQDFEFGQYFSVYPNPVKDKLNIETKQTIEVSSVSIYNALGQVVLVVPNTQNVKTVDVSSLSSGNYFIKVNSDKGAANTKFVKQ
ncbi:T9SS type A sorting domain-containing protein [Flavobacterium sp. SM15]|uniref:T9SS type A sorting domain-containing protein n=1 Tax=Flavobacterium sp. SM15 TaxID=2908005 RepID=UPI001EDA1545|nr:T9SS type A sorting domain-containing protein [Flavobacterium sp. SM15]MCG2610988.1 T9SS type A sorting domain-containing protein [Flavobacterium sp. SM15]